METLFEVITPWFDPTSTAAERNAVLWPAVRQLFIQLFTVDPHIQVKHYPGSEDMPNEYTLMSTIHRGTPVSQWPNTVWKSQKFFAENFYVHKSGDPQRTKLLIAHAVPAEEIMAFINPPPVPEGLLLEPPPRSLDWTLSVAPLQTVAAVSVAFLHGTVKRTNAKELQEAIMSHTVWTGCDIKIVLKSGTLKKSPREELTRETTAFGMMVFCAAKDYHQCLQKLSQIYLANVKSGFPLDRKYTVIPDMCSPCFTDHSSDECIPVLETYRASQVTTTKDVHEITLTGVSSLHTELSETHPGVTLNKFLMSLKSLKDSDSNLFLSADTNHRDPTKIHLSCLKCHAEEAEAVAARLGILSADRWGEVCWDVWYTSSYKVAQRVAFHRDPTSRAFLSPALDMFVKLAQTNLVKAEMELDSNYKREDSDIVLQIVSHMPGSLPNRGSFPTPRSISGILCRRKPGCILSPGLSGRCHLQCHQAHVRTASEENPTSTTKTWTQWTTRTSQDRTQWKARDTSKQRKGQEHWPPKHQQDQWWAQEQESNLPNAWTVQPSRRNGKPTSPP